jgi:acyl carrier protein
MQDELTQRVIQCIAKTQHIDAANITPESTFEQLNIDSLDGINIIFAVESEFNISVPDEAARELKSIAELVEGIRKLMAAPAA